MFCCWLCSACNSSSRLLVECDREGGSLLLLLLLLHVSPQQQQQPWQHCRLLLWRDVAKLSKCVSRGRLLCADVPQQQQQLLLFHCCGELLLQQQQ